MKHAVEMAPGAMIYIQSIIKISAGIQKLIGGDIQTHIQHGYCISLILFFQNEGSNLKNAAENFLYYEYIMEYIFQIMTLFAE
jgi:hypothetical protein